MSELGRRAGHSSGHDPLTRLHLNDPPEENSFSGRDELCSRAGLVGCWSGQAETALEKK